MDSTFVAVQKKVATYSLAVFALYISLASVSGVFTPQAEAASNGPNSASTFANDSTVGTTSWSSLTNAQTSNDSDASVSLDDNQISRYLKATGFGFAIPTGSTINGITVQVERRAQSSDRIKDSSVRIVKGGVIGTTNKANTSSFWDNNADVIATYGSTSDLWGQTWTVNDINDSNFGVVFAVKKDTTAGSNTSAFVDHIKITVSYTEAPGTIHVTTNTVGGDGTFNYTGAATFSVTTVGGTATHDITGLTAGTYSVNQDADTNYTTVNTCLNVVVTAGSTTNCTITNTKKGTLRVVKNAVGGNGTFNFTGAESFSITTSEGTGTHDIVNLVPGTYSVDEAVTAGWTTDDSDCQNKVVTAGAVTTCTVTNTAYGTLTVHKQTIGGNGTFSFSANSIGDFDVTTTDGAGSSDTFSVPVGTYTVSEDAVSGWQQNSNGCVNVAVTAGAASECTIVNQKQSHIELHKVSKDGIGDFTFTGLQEGGTQLTTVAPDTDVSTTIDFFTATDGTVYTLGETQVVGWNLTASSCMYPNQTTSNQPETGIHELTLMPGATIVCRYENTKSVCGNGLVQSGEQCDDSNTNDGDGCSETCQVELGWACNEEPSVCTTNCGDEIVAGAEQCDLGAENSNAGACTLACRNAVCGDGFIQESNGGETCDDSNAIGGDGCSASCHIETLICHIPPGNPANQSSQYVDPSMVDGHLNHGDYLGACVSSSASSVSSGASSTTSTSSSVSSSSGPDGDISITKTTTSENVSTEDAVTYTITVSNGSMSNAADLMIYDQIPAGMTFISATDGGGTDNSSAQCVNNEGVITCSLSADGMLQKNKTVVVTVVLGVTTTSCSTITNTATVTADINDISPEDNEDSAVVQANGVCSSSAQSSSSTSSFDNEESSSSSSFDNEESSASSSVIFSGFTTPETEEGGQGAFRGSRTNSLKGAANFLTGTISSRSIAPGAFGGAGNDALSDDEIQLICSMRKALPENASSILTEWFAGYLAALMNRDVDTILEALKDVSLCQTPELQTKAPSAPTSFVVNAAGFPVSSNPVWNNCIAGKATLADLRANTDKNEDGVPRSCSDYHTANLWYHPDFNVFFTFDRKTRKVTVPNGYAIRVQQEVSLNR